MKKTTRKFFSVILLAVIVVMAVCMACCLPGWAAAEEMAPEAAPAILFDVTDILIAAILAVGGYVWRKWLRPWLEERKLMDEAAIVVNAAEALIGRGYGTEKWEHALEWMNRRGFDVDAEKVEEALRAAWRKMNTEQLMAGEKTKPPEE